MTERTIVDPIDLVDHAPWAGAGELGAHGWIQWKGTNVCMDFYCECGAHGHIDADFTYYVECGACHRVYAMNPHVKAVPIDRASIDDGRHCAPIITEIFDERPIVDVSERPQELQIDLRDERSPPERKTER